jgi:hypothetical protein
VIAGRHHVDTPIQEGVADVLGHTEAGGGILGVGDREIDAVMFDEGTKAFAHQLASRPSDDVPDEEDIHTGRWESVSIGILCA